MTPLQMSRLDLLPAPTTGCTSTIVNAPVCFAPPASCCRCVISSSSLPVSDFAVPGVRDYTQFFRLEDSLRLGQLETTTRHYFFPC